MSSRSRSGLGPGVSKQGGAFRLYCPLFYSKRPLLASMALAGWRHGKEGGVVPLPLCLSSFFVLFEKASLFRPASKDPLIVLRLPRTEPADP